MNAPFIRDIIPYREREFPPLSPTSPYVPFIPYVGPNVPQIWANKLYSALDGNQVMETNRQYAAAAGHPYLKTNRPQGAMTNIQKEMENRMQVEIGGNNLVSPLRVSQKRYSEATQETPHGREKPPPGQSPPPNEELEDGEITPTHASPTGPP